MPHTPPRGAHGGASTPEPAPREEARWEAPRPSSIGAVLGVLRKEFPEVTVSRIRFLEAEGLVNPQRTPSGHRRFREADVERLRRVLGMQRDHCLPLRTVRERLDAEEPPPAAAPAGAAAPVRAGRERFLAAAGADETTCAEWEAYGLVHGDVSGGYDVGQVAVARILTELGRHGLRPRHLRSVKAAADRVACLVEQIVAPLRANRDPRTREHAEATAHELAHLTARLHDAFLRAALEPSERRDGWQARDTDARAERVPDYPNGPGTS